MRTYSDKVIYQIYPKSFYDSNQDGLGDFNGITSKLDYLADLGIDCLWLNACFVSPQRDNGYDVSNYYEVEPSFGTMEDFENLCKEAKQRGIDIMLDMVFNHTSTDHDWFQQALKGDKTYQNYYFFLPPEKDNLPPTNWHSKFGGNAWTYVPSLDLYYLHLFDVTQADLNWENPSVQQAMIDIVNYWQAKGVNGFRFDVINLISKPKHFQSDDDGDGRKFYTDGDKVIDHLTLLNQESFGRNPQALTVGEMSSTQLDKCVKYANGEQTALSMVFNFHHLKVDYKNNDKWSLGAFDFKALKSILFEWQMGMQAANAWMALFWCNHDQPRIVSRFGDEGEHRTASAKMLATTLHMMRGTPYIYQGEEIGMGNAYFESIEQYRDVESINYYHILKQQGMTEEEILNILGARSRDNARTPMQWDDSLYAGFSTQQPWIEVPKFGKAHHVKANQQDPSSILAHYKKLIRLRKTHLVIQEGDFIPLLADDEKILAYQRTFKTEEKSVTLLCINHFFKERFILDLNKLLSKSYPLKEWSLLLNNYEQLETVDNSDKIIIEPYHSLIFLLEKNSQG